MTEFVANRTLRFRSERNLLRVCKIKNEITTFFLRYILFEKCTVFTSLKLSLLHTYKYIPHHVDVIKNIHL